MLWSTSDQAWLADHQLVDDLSTPCCQDVNDALGFSSYDAALERVRYLMQAMPGIDIRQVRLECDSATYPNGWRMIE